MDMQDAMEYVTSEGLRLQAIGVSRSNVIMSTFLEGGDIARLTVTVDLIPASAMQKEVPKEQQKPQVQQMPLDSRYSGGRPQVQQQQ
jgi:lipopolysaccharide export LptBFGC system permease protein LptF